MTSNESYDRRRTSKYCFLKTCPNNNTRTPHKKFFNVPAGSKEEWCRAAGLSRTPTRSLFVCQDHLNLEEDMENYYCWKLMNYKAKLKPRLPAFLLKKQKKRSKRKSPQAEPSALNKPTPSTGFRAMCRPNVTNKKVQVKASEQDGEPDPSGGAPVTPPWHPDSAAGTSDLSNLQDPLRKTVEQCRFCGKFSKDCVAVSSHMAYVVGDKTTLSLNDTSITLDFNYALPNTVCRDCDNKLTEISEFVKLVKTSQDILANVKTECESEADLSDISDNIPVFEDHMSYKEVEVIKTEAPDDIDIADMEIFIKTEAEDYNESNQEIDNITFEDSVFIKTLSPKRKYIRTNQKQKGAKKIKLDPVKTCDIKLGAIKMDAEHEGSRISDAREPEIDVARAIVEPGHSVSGSTEATTCVPRIFSKKKNRLS